MSMLKLLKEFQSTYMTFHAQHFTLSLVSAGKSWSLTGSGHLSPLMAIAHMSFL